MHLDRWRSNIAGVDASRSGKSDRGAGTGAAVAALLLATVFWGCGFTWAKAAGEIVNSYFGLAQGAPLGPMWVLAARFLAAGILWLIFFPQSRRGWSGRDVGSSLLLGGILSAGLVVQHLGLDRTSEAVSAFLTSLTILFVPLMMTFILRRPPRGVLWVGVALATVGVFLLTGASPSGFGIGELLGLCCAVSYSVDIIVLNLVIRPESASRLTAGQFLVVGISNLLVCLLLPGGPRSIAHAPEVMRNSALVMDVALLTLLPTIGAFGLQFRFQPRVDPARAALIYLMEPIFASIFALAITGRRLGLIAVVGAALIVVANLLVEIVSGRGQARRQSNADEQSLREEIVHTPLID
jgi:drug/metabolite transporter (DMT)-like permease